MDAVAGAPTVSRPSVFTIAAEQTNEPPPMLKNTLPLVYAVGVSR